MKSKKSANPPVGQIVRIKGKTPLVIDAVLTGQPKVGAQYIPDPRGIESQIRLDKNRIPIYTGRVTDPDVLRAERANFYSKIDGSAYGKKPVLDTSYAQGDYFSGIGKWMVASFSERENLIHLLMVDEAERKQHAVSFGYVNDLGVPCGLEILDIEIDGMREHIITHVEHLDKPKEERDSTVYMTSNMYNFFNQNDLMPSLGKVQSDNPEQLKVGGMLETTFPSDLSALLKSTNLTRDLQPLFTGAGKLEIQVSAGGYVGQKENDDARLVPEKIVPITHLDPQKLDKPPRQTPNKLFDAAYKELQAKYDNGQPSTANVRSLVNNQLVNYIATLIEDVSSMDKQSSLVASFNEFKAKFTKQKNVEPIKESVESIKKLVAELTELQEKVANGEEKYPVSEIYDILKKLSSLKSTTNERNVADYAVGQLKVDFVLLLGKLDVVGYLAVNKAKPDNEAKPERSLTSSDAGNDPSSERSSDDDPTDNSDYDPESDSESDNSMRP